MSINVKTLNRIKNIGVIFLMALLLVTLTSTMAYADNIKVIGNDIGLLVTPADTNLFEEMNMNPGDCKEATITIENNYTSPFRLYLKINRLDEEPPLGDPDLLKQIMATISYRNVIIHQGPMSDFISTANGIDLGKYNPGDVQEIKVTVCLPGAETGNEFMGLSAKNEWIFTAQGEEKEADQDKEDPSGGGKRPVDGGKTFLGGINPKTGVASTMILSILGLLLVSMGIVIVKRDQ